MPSKQLSIPGFPLPEPKNKPLTQNERIEGLTDRVLKLELEVTLLKIQLGR